MTHDPTLPPATRQEALMNSIRSRLTEIHRLSKANKVDADELKQAMDRTSYMVFMASTFVAPEGAEPEFTITPPAE